MTRVAKLLLPVLACLLGVGIAAAQSPPVAPPLAAQAPPTPGPTQSRPPTAGPQAPYTVQYERHLTLETDFTATELITQRVTVLSPGAIQALSQQQLSFIEGMLPVDIVEAFTEKSDGRRIDVDPANIITRDAATGLQATYLRDQKQLTLIFPDVEIGDTLVLKSRTQVLKNLFPGQFTSFQQLPRSLPFTSAQVTIDVPAALDVQVKAMGDGVVDHVESLGDLRRHSVIVTPRGYYPEEPGSVSPLDREPAVIVSTMRSYEDLGLAFGRAALPKAEVTPEIAALADEITKGIDDSKAQAAAIDAWMKKNIRYVAVYLALGRVIPNEAASVLKNKFGDCKDKVTLMSALLSAKGIASEEVLINLGNAYTLPEPPTLGGLNHVILYLPDFDLYDDPTVSEATFGGLAAPAYDKPVVRVSKETARLARTPAMRPEDHTASATTRLAVAADGTITGQTRESHTGTFGIALRAAGETVQALGEETAAQRLLAELQHAGPRAGGREQRWQRRRSSHYHRLVHIE